MATKISDLTSVSSLDGSELIEVVQSGANKKATIGQINAITSHNPTPLVTLTRADHFICMKSGNTVQVIINNVSFEETGVVGFATIPFHPQYISYFVGYDLDGTMIKFSIRNDGVISVINGTGKLLYGSFTFVAV